MRGRVVEEGRESRVELGGVRVDGVRPCRGYRAFTQERWETRVEFGQRSVML